MSNTAQLVKQYRTGLLDGTWTPDHSSTIARLADDPDELDAAIAKANDDPKIAMARATMLAPYAQADTAYADQFERDRAALEQAEGENDEPEDAEDDEPEDDAEDE